MSISIEGALSTLQVFAKTEGPMATINPKGETAVIVCKLAGSAQKKNDTMAHEGRSVMAGTPDLTDNERYGDTLRPDGAWETEELAGSNSSSAAARVLREDGPGSEVHLADAALAAAAAATRLPPSLHGMTLAEAERFAMERGHATLLETQFQRIAELEVQLQRVQAQARESGDAYEAQEPPRAMRHRLPAERASITHKFQVAGHDGYITVGLFPNGSPGEIFLRMAREGSSVSGLLDSFATTVSLALQHGLPLQVLVEHFAETRFEPAGATTNEQIPYARSIMDYLFRWMELRFLSGHQMDLFTNLSPASPPGETVRVTGTVSGPKSSVMPNLFGGVRSTGNR